MRFSVVVALVGAITLEAGIREVGDEKAALDVENSDTPKFGRTYDQKAAAAGSLEAERKENIFCTMTHNLAARENASKNRYRVNIRLSSQVPLPPALLKDGQESATTTFAGIHVQLTWEAELHQASNTLSAGTGRSTMNDLAIEIVPHAPASFSNAALAMAMPYAASGVRIVIFYDRVEPLLRGHHAPQAKILGYVLAHEIAHVLQGIARHSDTGIMRARWLENDFKQMGIGALTFTGEDIQLIRHRLDSASV